MKIKKAMWFLGMTTIAAAAFVLQAGTAKGPTAGVGGKASDAIEVKIDNFKFGPMTLTIPAGTTVTWTNNDSDPHTVVSNDRTTFKSPALDEGEKYSYTFAKPGKYAYFCSVHPKMTAEVVVK